MIHPSLVKSGPFYTYIHTYIHTYKGYRVGQNPQGLGSICEVELIAQT
jgi:ABC-type transporter Mla maintaining outer membrane lipid asymmetry permease subunit MlaE